MIEKFPQLNALVQEMTAHKQLVTVTAEANVLSPDLTVADTHITAAIPGAATASSPNEPPYTHCIHRYRVIGGDDITWVTADDLGSTTGGPFGEGVLDDDVLDLLWADILDALDISEDPHQLP